MIWIWISCQKRLKLQMGVAGPFFEPHPSNLVRFHFFLSCKNAKIFVVIFQLVSNWAKISVSVPSISWGVLGLACLLQFFCYLVGSKQSVVAKLRRGCVVSWGSAENSVWEVGHAQNSRLQQQHSTTKNDEKFLCEVICDIYVL